MAECILIVSTSLLYTAFPPNVPEPVDLLEEGEEGDPSRPRTRAEGPILIWSMMAAVIRDIVMVRLCVS